jgi:MFS family permease
VKGRRARDESVAAVAGRAHTRALVPYFLVSSVLSLGYGSVLTLLAEIRDRFGLSETEVGAIAAAGFAAGFVSQTALARFADRGHAALLVRVGIASSITGLALCVVAKDVSVWLLARTLIGLGTGMVSPATRRVVIARDPDNVGTNLGTQGSFDVAGFVVGPLLAAVCAEFIGFRSPFVVLAVLNVAMFVLVARLDLRSGVLDQTKRRVMPLLRLPAMQAALFSSIAFYMTIGMFDAVWSLVLDDLGASLLLIGVSFSLFTIPMVVLAPIGGRTAQRRGPLNVVVFSLAVATLCTLSYGFAPLWVVLVVSCVHACADSFTMPGNQVAVAMSSPPDQLAAGQGLLGSVGLLVAGAMGLVGGRLFDRAGRGWVFGLTAAGMAVFVVLAQWRAAADRRSGVGQPSSVVPRHS